MRDYLAQAIFKAVEFDFHNVQKKASSLGRKMSLNISIYAHYIQTPSGIIESVCLVPELFLSLLWQMQAKSHVL